MSRVALACISRNRLIIRALEQTVLNSAEPRFFERVCVGWLLRDWSPDFFDQLSTIDEATAANFDETMAAVRAQRRSKTPRSL